MKKREPGSFQQSPVTGQQPMDTSKKIFFKKKKDKLNLNTREHFFYCEVCQTLEQVVQRGYAVFICGEYSKPDWRQSWDICSC